MMWYEKIWYGKEDSFVISILTPLSAVYKNIINFRHWLYKKNILKIHKLSVPVIVVGNITMGGTGKTPLVIALALWLKEKGLKPGIISRGYGGRSKNYPLLVKERSPSTEVGDEPLVIATRSQCPVIVDPNRVRGAQLLINEYNCDIIISDDGLQHSALGRDIEILVIDGERQFGNGHLFPAGPLRESVDRVQQVDFVISNGTEIPNGYSMNYEYGNVTNLIDPSIKLEKENASEEVFAFAGVGNPKRFFNELDRRGFKSRKHSFPDHYAFDSTDFAFTERTSVIMTEKDAVKCHGFAQPNFWYLPISARLPTEFWTNLAQKLTL